MHKLRLMCVSGAMHFDTLQSIVAKPQFFLVVFGVFITNHNIPTASAVFGCIHHVKVFKMYKHTINKMMVFESSENIGS